VNTIKKLRRLSEEKVVHVGPMMLMSVDASKLLALVEAVGEQNRKSHLGVCNCDTCAALRALEAEE
jgi:hypothetical protein